jgi:hypothetical protein
MANFSVNGIPLEFSHPSLENGALKKLTVLSTQNKNKTSLHYVEKVMKINLAPHEAIVINCMATVAVYKNE